MKNLHSIFILFILSTSAVSAIATDCKVNSINIVTEYSGDCRNGLANGKGVAIGIGTYVGEFRDGNKHGNGVYTEANGNRYEGEYRDNKRVGKGVYTWSTGDRYEGDFFDNEIHGKGLFTGVNGYRYEGDFRDNKRTGKGVFTWNNGSRYVGDFEDDKIQGFGVRYLAQGRALSNGGSEIGELQGTIIGLWRDDKLYKRFYGCDSKVECEQKEAREVAAANVQICKPRPDGTFVTANGIIWQICQVGQSYDNGQCVGTAKNLTWMQAVVAAKGNRYLGKSDWSIPSTSDFLQSFSTTCGLRLISHIEPTRYFAKQKFNGVFWTNTRDADQVEVMNQSYSEGTTSVFFDTNKDSSRGEYFYSDVRTILARNLPEGSQRGFDSAFTFVAGCDAKCRAAREKLQSANDRESIARYRESWNNMLQDFRNAGGGGSSSSSSSTGGNFVCTGKCTGSWFKNGSKITITVSASSSDKARESAAEAASNQGLCHADAKRYNQSMSAYSLDFRCESK